MIFGKLFGGKTSKTTSVDVDPRYKEFLDSNLDRAEAAFSGFNPYTGERIADFAQDELDAFTNIRDLANNETLSRQVQTQGLERFLGAPTLDDLQPFTDPFADAVIDRSAQRVYDSYDRQLSRIRNDAGGQAAYGGSRQAVAEANLIEGLGQQIGDLSYRGYSDAFNQGMDRYYQTGAEGIRQAQGVEAADFSRQNQLASIGQRQRALEQAGLDFQFDEFTREQIQPREDALALSQIAAAYPRDIFSRTETQRKSPGIFNAVAGLAGSVAGLGGIFGGGGGGSEGAAAGGGQASGFTPGAFSSPGIGTSFSYSPGTISGSLNSSLGELPQFMATGGKVTTTLTDDEQDTIQEYYDKTRRGGLGSVMLSDDEQQFVQNAYDGMFDRVPTPRVKPNNPFEDPSDGRVSMPITNPFVPSSEVEAKLPQMPVFGEEPKKAAPRQDERDWLDRWVDNPFTQLGFSLLAGTDTDLGRSAGMLLSQRQAEKDQQRQDAQRQEDIDREALLLQQERARQDTKRAQDLELTRERLKQDQENKRLDREFRAQIENKKAEERAIDRQLRQELAEMSAGRGSDNRGKMILDTLKDSINETSKDIRNLQDAEAEAAAVRDEARVAEIKEAIRELEGVRDGYQRKQEELLGVKLRDEAPNRQQSSGPSDDPLGLFN